MTVTHVVPDHAPTALCGATIERPDQPTDDNDPACGACLRLAVEAYEACLVELRDAHERLDHVLSVVLPPGAIVVSGPTEAATDAADTPKESP